MKIASYRSENGAERTAVVDGDILIDLASCGQPGTMMELLHSGIDVDAIGRVLDQGTKLPLEKASLLAPVSNPGQSARHRSQLPRSRGRVRYGCSEAPGLVQQAAQLHQRPYAPINLPSVSPMLDYEASCAW